MRDTVCSINGKKTIIHRKTMHELDITPIESMGALNSCKVNNGIHECMYKLRLLLTVNQKLSGG